MKVCEKRVKKSENLRVFALCILLERSILISRMLVANKEEEGHAQGKDRLSEFSVCALVSNLRAITLSSGNKLVGRNCGT